jgi:iron complex outermembrane receptor protein
MKRTNPVTLLAAWLALMFGSPEAALAADGGSAGSPAHSSGAITGQVSNAATRSFLEGAVVTVAGTGRSVTTDREGRYQITGVGGDQVNLEVSFAGLDAQRVTVAVGPGQRVVRNVELTSDIYKMDKFTVAGMREGTALAETLQRQAPNVKNVVSSDAFGNIPSGSLGELLQHIVGVTGNFNGNDVTAVSIRGVGPDLNSVTMDGQQISAAQNAQGGRQAEFEQSSLNNIETIEVTKAPTPDMDGASIGGSINLVSKSAFDRAEDRAFRYTLGFATQPKLYGTASKWQQPIRGFGPSVNFNYSAVIGEKRNIGLTLTGTLNSQPVGGLLTTNAYERRNDSGPAFNYSAQRLATAGATATRATIGAKVDYRWSPQTTITVNTFYNYFMQNNDDHAHTVTTVGVATAAIPNLIATVDASGNRTGGGFIAPGYTNTFTRVFADPTQSFSTISHFTNTKSGRTYLISPRVRHRFDGMDIDYSLSYSNAGTYYNTGLPMRFDSRRKGNVTLRLNNVGWIADRSQDIEFPSITQTQGPNMFLIRNYTSTPVLLQQNGRQGEDSVLGGKFDLKRDLRLAVPVYFKTGATYQRQTRAYRMYNRRYNYVGPDGVAGTPDDFSAMSQFADTRGIKTSADEIKYMRNRGGLPEWPNAYAIADHRADNPLQWREDLAFHVQNKLQNTREVEESIAAVYLMGNVRFGKFSTLAGVRMEDTRLSGEGGVDYISPEERARRLAWIGPVTEAESVRRIEAQYGGRDTNEGDYRVVLPGVHLKYQPTAGLMMRASWSTGVGRPPFGSIIPATVANDDTRRVTVNNPNLKPQYGHNFDLGLEYYFKPQGMISVGAFRKKIRDYIYTDGGQMIGSGTDNGFDGDYAGYALTTQANGGSAKIEGLEFSYQQQLVFLPGWAKGFGVYANYTTLRTEGNYGGATSVTGNSLPGFIPKNGNAGIGYRGYGFDVRIQAVYRGRYLRAFSATPSLVTFQKPKTTWNLKSRYDLSRRLSVFLDLENVFEAPLDSIYALYPDRITSMYLYHTKIVGGVIGRF